MILVSDLPLNQRTNLSTYYKEDSESFRPSVFKNGFNNIIDFSIKQDRGQDATLRNLFYYARNSDRVEPLVTLNKSNKKYKNFKKRSEGNRPPVKSAGDFVGFCNDACTIKRSL